MMHINNRDLIPTADELYELLKRLFPITRSITGDGVRESLSIIQEYVDLQILEFPSGSKVYDWTVPEEWNINDAYVMDVNGNKLIDFQDNGLHVVSYSVPVDQEMTFEELEEHLYSLPSLPDAIPYRTSYYKRNWGFCLSHNQLEAMDKTSKYHVRIDSELTDGSLVLAESILDGELEDELLVSTYCCHPWMANDNQSGVIVTTFLCNYLAKKKNRRYSYRFLWLPETIGAITYLAHNEDQMKKIKGGFVVSCCGGKGKLSYKPSFIGEHLVDRAVMLAFRDRDIKPWIRPFAPDGSDERQYSMPAFRIPVGTISKDKYYDYKYYHTSLDNLEYVSGESMLSSFQVYVDAIEILERNYVYLTTMPYCEPELGRRGLYPQVGGSINQSVDDCRNDIDVKSQLDAIKWLMFLADGSLDLVSIAERSEQPFEVLFSVAEKLKDKGLLELVL